ncbi:MAG: flagellar type III secretion system protein FlhB [Gammaproteobacteria bacterium]|nr:flagellar type III secretion system protein FlhB [Gammaproteobacteria bacterium]NNJ95834.1 flagellar type III secretion system protein FlhB [Gammaproteobacteria bacterium]
MAQETGQERTEQPTPKRLREAREKGQVPRSKELNSMALLMASAGGFLLMGESILTGMQDIMSNGLALEQARDIDKSGLIALLGNTLLQSLLVVAPLFLLLMVVVVFTPIGLGGWSFSTKALSFKWEKLDPVKGIGRIFAWRGLMELLKVLAKFTLVAAISIVFLWSLVDEILGLGAESIKPALAHVASLCGWSFLASSSVLIIVAAIDVPFQLWQHNKQLRMTKQEVKDETKETDGRPEVKGRIRALQQELSQRRMMEAVPQADVVITNPTHYAVALRYDATRMQAPLVVAKGADLVAARIRQVADKHDVTIVSAPPLARALYASTDLNQEIPAGLYVAVANILSYVYQLNSLQADDAIPVEPTDLPIPDEWADALRDDLDEP